MFQKKKKKNTWHEKKKLKRWEWWKVKITSPPSPPRPPSLPYSTCPSTFHMKILFFFFFFKSWNSLMTTVAPGYSRALRGLTHSSSLCVCLCSSRCEVTGCLQNRGRSGERHKGRAVRATDRRTDRHRRRTPELFHLTGLFVLDKIM